MTDLTLNDALEETCPIMFNSTGLSDRELARRYKHWFERSNLGDSQIDLMAGYYSRTHGYKNCKDKDVLDEKTEY